MIQLPALNGTGKGREEDFLDGSEVIQLRALNVTCGS